MLPAIHIGLDLYASPLWVTGPDGKLENRRPTEFTLSEGLAEDLRRWAGEYDHLADLLDGTPSSGARELELLDQAGEELWRRLVEELGAVREVHYDSPIHGGSWRIHRPDVTS